MFTIDSDNNITAYSTSEPAEFSGDVEPFETPAGLEVILLGLSGERSVAIWNKLATIEPQVAPILTPKFRNKSTAVERIWNRLAQLYPDAILESDMPKAKTKKTPKPKAEKTAKPRKARKLNSAQKRTSAWADELTAELKKRFKPGDEFGLEDVYKMAPAFQRRHKENHHVAARLRTTLAQDLRGRLGIVKQIGKGKYRMR